MLDLLGKGGFACVYRAKSKNNGQEVAIKMVCVDVCSLYTYLLIHLDSNMYMQYVQYKPPLSL